ncbi:MAG: leucine-rich repeat domain-containing protein, partial [Mycoplasmataceae bacterium]|nr:leucine-rich repeat domain-containing protein [Mycoplasmataceae bacterium]
TFKNCTSLTGELTFPQTLTTIGNSAFEDCDGFTTTLILPNTIETLGNFAFKGCNHFTTLRFSGFAHNPEWDTIGTFDGWNTDSSDDLFVNSTDEELWSNWEARDYAISKGLGFNWIGEKNYKKWDGSDWKGHNPLSGTLTCVKEGIGSNACAKISLCSDSYEATDLVIPDYVKIGDEVLPLKKIGDAVFTFKPNLHHNLTIGENITTIGRESFRGNVNLNGTLILGEKVENIEQLAFFNCRFENKLVIPKNVQSIEEDAFSECDFSSVDISNNSFFRWATNVGEHDECKILITTSDHPQGEFNYAADKPAGGIAYGHLTIPEDVTTIGDNAFYGCSKLIGELIIPNTVHTIDQQAFNDCNGLNSLTISFNTANIGNNAFHHCDNIQTLYIYDFNEENQPTGWANNIFNGWKSDGNPTVMDSSVQSWKARDFAVSKGLGLNWVGGVYKEWDGSNWDGHTPGQGTLVCTRQGNNVSNYYAEIESVEDNYQANNLVIPDYVKMQDGKIIPLKTIKTRAFYQKTGLTGNLTIGNNISNIDSLAFLRCDQLNGNLNLGSKITNIGDDAFSQCTGLKGNLIIPDSVTTIGTNAFYRCLSLNGTFRLGNKVESIGSFAFGECSNLQGELSIPDSVTSIGNSAFDGCSKFKQKLSIGKEVSTIGTKAFSNCNFNDVEVNALNTHFQLANNVEAAKILIPKDEYHKSSNFIYNSDKPTGGVAYGHLVIQGNPSSIGQEAFEDCNKLTGELIIPASVHEIGKEAFRNCKGLTSLSNIWRCRVIEEQAFYHCDNLSGKLQLNGRIEGSQSIGSQAFAQCYNITRLEIVGFDINYQPTLWNNDIFTGWKSGTNAVEVFNNYFDIDNNEPYEDHEFLDWNVRDFAITKGLGMNWVGGVVKLWDGSNWDGRKSGTITLSKKETGTSAYAVIESISNDFRAEDLVIPEYVKYSTNYDVLPVKKIGDDAFKSETNLTGRITIGNKINTIGISAFEGCTGLTSTTIGTGVEKIDGSAFKGCQNLTGNLLIPNKVKTIGISAFEGCSGLTSISIGVGVEEIGNSAFKDCSSLNNRLILPTKLKTIGNYAFYNCTNLTGTLSIPANIKTIPNYAFQNCANLTNLSLPDGLEEIGDWAFANSENLNCSLIIPDGTKNIHRDAFYNCSKLTSLSLPDSLDEIGTSAFYNCSNLNCLISIPEKITVINERVFENCIKINRLNLPNNLIRISSFAFYHCSSLEGDLTIPDKVTFIGASSFNECSSLTSLTIPPSVTEISSNAFKNCSGLKGELILHSTLTTLKEQAFYGCNGFDTLTFDNFEKSPQQPEWGASFFNIFSGWNNTAGGVVKVTGSYVNKWTAADALLYARTQGLDVHWRE